MPYKTEWESGQHNVVCAICQAVFKSRHIQPDWRGLLVCDADRDPRPKNLFYKPTPPADPKPVKEVQGPESADTVYIPLAYPIAEWPIPTP